MVAICGRRRLVFTCISEGKDLRRPRDVFFDLGPLIGGVGATNAVVLRLGARAEFSPFGERGLRSLRRRRQR
jgi:hypothetical protein